MNPTRSWLVVFLIPGLLSAATESNDVLAQETETSLAELQADAPPEEPTPDAAALAERALEIAAREIALRQLEASVRQQIEELTELQRQALLVLEPERAQQAADLKKLVSFYQNMKPKQAAGLLEKLPIDLATKVLSSMKQREAGKILNVMNAARAVQISKRMAETPK